MKELVVISGKGGTGKTSLLASFAALAPNAVVADCDVDAADLHLVLDPHVLQREPFVGGQIARVRTEACTACGRCAEACRFDAIRFDGPASDAVGKTYRVDALACEGCSVCALVCPAEAIELSDAVCGEWAIAETRHGPLVHARLHPGAGNSGRLVTLVREQARQIAEREGRDLILIDGPPGLGCPVIASITGADAVLIVTEPTVSGLHDLKRVLSLVRHFGLRAFVCVNKYDINPDCSLDIIAIAQEAGARAVGRIRYDQTFVDAQLQGRSVVECDASYGATAVRAVWDEVAAELENARTPKER